MTHRRMIMLSALLVGALLLLGGAGGFYSLFVASRSYEKTTGVVRDVRTKKVYRHRRLRYESKMLVSYPTSKYGELRVLKDSYCPFRSKGDELVVWYDSARPEEIRLPRSECAIWAVLLFVGIVLVRVGLACGKTRNASEKIQM